MPLSDVPVLRSVRREGGQGAEQEAVGQTQHADHGAKERIETGRLIFRTWSASTSLRGGRLDCHLLSFVDDAVGRWRED